MTILKKSEFAVYTAINSLRIELYQLLLKKKPESLMKENNKLKRDLDTETRKKRLKYKYTKNYFFLI